MINKSAFIGLICLLLFCQFSFSQQKEKLSLEAGGSIDFALYEGTPSLGLGGHLKLLKPIKNNNNFLAGTIDINLLSDVESFGSDVDLLFILASMGYRIQKNSFFIEPKIGGGLFNEYGYNSPCLFLGIEPGIDKNRFAFSVDLRFFTADGIAYGARIGTAFFKFGYKLL